ncbi:hypothetical protein JI58_00380 [Marinosulfonomonas sp. PRT-SC04]|nr:hypothetical protein JI58_00380 [Marinosulfonomonas sp. PRT-SC04]
MQIARGKMTLALIAVLAISACGNKNNSTDTDLMNIRASGNGPDEFTILPSKTLKTPDFTAALPAPTPGATNLTDPTPKADAVAALGGNPNLVGASGNGSIGRGDATLVNHARRYGANRTIRQVLAAEDLEFRRKHKGRLLERWFNVNTYYKAYKKVSLDQYRALERFRRLGVRTPSAPPD